MEPQRAPRARAAVRGNDLATIHIEATACGLIKPARDGFPKNDDDYRQLVRTISNGTTDSAATLDSTQRQQLIDHLRKLKRALGKGGMAPQWNKLRALWVALAKAGHVSDASERAMNAWALRQCGKPARWASNAQLEAMIEAAKAWLARPAKTERV